MNIQYLNPKVAISLLRKFRLNRISSKVNVDPQNSLIIFTSGRGGSTWLNNILRCLPNTATVWEPLAVGQGTVFDDIGLNWAQYIPLNAEWEEADKAFEQLLSGDILTWPSTLHERQQNGLDTYTKANRLIFKFVNANALAPWLLKKWKFRQSPIFLLRHPMATVCSRVKHGAWKHVTNTFRYPETRYNDLFDKHRHYLDSLGDPYSIHIAKWCIQNLPLIEVSRNGSASVHTIFYERIVLDREGELNRLFDSLQESIPDDVFSTASKASATTRSGSPLHGKDQLAHWRKSVDKETINNMQKVLDYFGIDFYSGQSDQPDEEVFFRR